jgi:hypothetical protein
MQHTLHAGFSIIGLIIVAIIWILSAIFKKKEEGGDQFELPPELKPRRGQAPPQPVARSWEEELRRVLEQPAAPPPPPMIREAVSAPQPIHRTHVPMPAPVAVIEPHIQVTLVSPHQHVQPAFQHLPGLTDSSERYAQAMSLEERVTRHMGDVTSHRVGTTAAVHREFAPELYDAVSAIRTRRGARSAILASIIIGPPRALEEF